MRTAFFIFLPLPRYIHRTIEPFSLRTLGGNIEIKRRHIAWPESSQPSPRMQVRARFEVIAARYERASRDDQRYRAVTVRKDFQRLIDDRDRHGRCLDRRPILTSIMRRQLIHPG